MKNAFVTTSLVVIASYPVAIILEIIGVVPFSVRSLPTFVSLYAAVGVVAFAFADYSRTTRANQRSSENSVAQLNPSAKAHTALTLALRPGIQRQAASAGT